MIETQKIVLKPKSESLQTKPKVIVWQKEKMIRNHSVKAAIREILQVSKNKDVVKIGIIGEPASGKSTQADTIGHLIHTMSREVGGVPYAARSYKEEDFIDIKKTLANLDPANYVLKFGDLSFLKGSYGSRKIEELKQAMTKIRHLPGGQDVKMILIYDYHYTLALDKYLRQSDFKFFTTVGSSERENMANIVGKKYYERVSRFKDMTTSMLRTDTFSYPLGDKWFTYTFRKPFIPMLFWNEKDLRDIVSPTRQWIDPICSVCSMADDTLKDSASTDKIIELGIRNWGPGNFKAAIKLKLHQQGINVYGPKVTNCSRWLDKLSTKTPVNLEDIAVKCGIHQKKTQLPRHVGKLIDEVVNAAETPS